MRRFNGVIDRLNEWVAVGISYFLIALMLVVTYEVVARYVFNRPTIWAYEVSQFLLLLVSALGGAFTLKVGGHVNVDIVFGRLAPKTRAIISLITSLLVFLFLSVLLWQSWDLFFTSFGDREHSSSLFAPPIYPVKLVMVVGVFLILLQAIARFFKYLLSFMTGVDEVKETGLLVRSEER